MSLENPFTSILSASVDSLAGRTLTEVTGTRFRLRRIVVSMSSLLLFRAIRDLNSPGENIDPSHLLSDSAEGHSQTVK